MFFSEQGGLQFAACLDRFRPTAVCLRSLLGPFCRVPRAFGLPMLPMMVLDKHSGRIWPASLVFKLAHQARSQKGSMAIAVRPCGRRRPVTRVAIDGEKGCVIES